MDIDFIILIALLIVYIILRGIKSYLDYYLTNDKKYERLYL